MRRNLAVCLFLVVATLAVYGQTARHDFVNFDDDHYVYANPHVRDGLTGESLGWAFTAVWSSNWHPLTWLSHMLDCELFGLEAGYHHLVNVLLHILNSMLLYLVLRRMTGAIWRSAMVAALFALHPLHVESVAWVSERKDVLSTLFFMLTLWAYGWYVERPGPARYVPVFLCLALGLMAKPMLVTLPFVLLLLDYWPLRRLRLAGWMGAEQSEDRDSEARDGRETSALQLVVEKIPLFVLVAASSVWTFIAQQSGGSTHLTHVVPFGQRAANALVSYVAYIGKMIWPSGLAAFYPYRLLLPTALWVGAGAIIAAISVFIVRAGRKRGYLIMGWLWYLGILAPVIGLVQVGKQSMADRYTYVSLIGLFIILAWGVADLTARWQRRHAWLAGSASLVILGCMATSWIQAGYWRDGITLFERVLKVTENNAPAHNNLGRALEVKGKLDEAAEHYRKALRIIPDYALAHSNLGNVLAAQGELDEAVRHYQEAIRSNPQFALAHTELGIARARQGRIDEAVAFHREALRLAPENPNAHSRLGVALMEQGNMEQALMYCREAVRLNPESAGLRNNLGFLLARQGRDDEAIAQYHEALLLDPEYVRAHDNLGVVLARRGRLDEAIAQLRKALALDSDLPEAHRVLAIALGQKGNHREALKHYREAIRLRPDDPGSLNNLAWILATHPDSMVRNGPEAVELAERACALLDRREIDLLDTLAAAYAEAGRFSEAIVTLEEAIALAAPTGPEGRAKILNERLQGYRAGLPFRQPPNGTTPGES